MWMITHFGGLVLIFGGYIIIIWAEWCLSRVFGILLQIHQKNLCIGQRPPPLFWQCQDFHGAYFGHPSLIIDKRDTNRSIYQIFSFANKCQTRRRLKMWPQPNMSIQNWKCKQRKTLSFHSATNLEMPLSSNNFLRF